MNESPPQTTSALPARWHSTNLVGLPSGLIASAAFNDYPLPLHIAGAREMNPHLFEMLERSASPADACEAFQAYMSAMFGLDPEQREKRSEGGPRRFRSSYLRLLRGWGYDTNSPEGAVLKGWVESRFGLFPTYHKQPILRFASAEWRIYMAEKMSSRFHNNSIQCQLDLLYEFCQWSLARYFVGTKKRLTLYRGVNAADEHQTVERIDRRNMTIRMNSLVSFSSERDIAGQFGDYILEAQVPVGKILFFNELMPTAPLKGEHEYLVIGGDYRVTTSYL